MPILPGQEDKYGKVIGHWLNMGKSKEVAKKYAEAAVGIANAKHKKKNKS
jgi:hypothetical protein